MASGVAAARFLMMSASAYTGEPSGWYDQGSLSAMTCSPALLRLAGGHYSKRSKGAAPTEVSAVADTIGQLLVTIGADRPPGARGYEDVVSQPRSVLNIFISVGRVAIV